MPHITRRIHCQCCDLDHDLRVEDTFFGAIERCPACQRHMGADDATKIRRGTEHVAMYREALIEAENDADRAYRKAEDNWQRMKSAYRTREMVVRALWEISERHHLTPKGCKCGRRDCKVGDILDRRGVERLVTEYDAKQERLWHARHDDDDVWVEEWDELDPVIDDGAPARRPPRPAGSGVA